MERTPLATRPFRSGLVARNAGSVAALGALFAFSAGPAAAQPSGGPYGPVPQTYTVPAGAPHVYYVAPDGKADAAGTTLEEPTTLEAAIERVVTGDAIVLRGGTYRTGGLSSTRAITLQPYADERPVLKGTQVATEWEALRATSGGRPGRRCSRPRPWAGGSATARACARRCTASTTTWCSWTASC